MQTLRIILAAVLLTSLTWASTEPHVAALHELLSKLPRWHEDTTEPDEARAERLRTIATAQVTATGGDVPAAVFLATVSWWESRLAKHVHEGACRPWECDRGRARGLAQVQLASGVDRDLWERSKGTDYPATLASMQAAHYVYSRAVRACGPSIGEEHRLFAFYARSRCNAEYPDGRERAAWYRKKLAEYRGLLEAKK
jgi:hypothetical protein